MCQPRVIFIGGASASGKTEAAKSLASELKRPHLEIDRLRDLANGQCELLSNSGEIEKSITRIYTRALLEILIDAGSECVIEGGWMEPKVATELTARQGFAAVYCGYSSDNLEARLVAIRTKAKNRHWLSEEPEKDAIKYLASQVEGSEWYKSECEEYELPYFDFTDQAKGQRDLCAYFLTS